MAAPITHFVLADKIFNQHFGGKDRRKFFIGTIFPDIRHLGVVEREKVHPRVSFSDLKNADSFDAGFGFHSFIDVTREDFMVKRGIYSIIPKSRLAPHALKFLEDQILYEKLSNWQLVADFLEDILEEEISYGIDQKDVVKWHELIRGYIAEKPTIQSVKNFALCIGINETVFKEIETLFKSIKDNKRVIAAVQDFYASFEPQ